MTRLLLPCALLLLTACASAPAARPAPPATTDSAAQPATDHGAHAAGTGHASGGHAHASTPRRASPIVVPLDAATRAALPRETAGGTVHGRAIACEGVSLVALLRAADAMPQEPMRGSDLDRYVQVDANDGHRAVFSLAELDPTLGANPVVLVDRCDGAPLDASDGPLRLVAPRESRPARWVRQVKSITVIAAP